MDHQAERPILDTSAPSPYEGIGFYVTSDDLELNLDDVLVESGFRKRQALPR